MAQLLEAPHVSLKHPASSAKSFAGKGVQIAVFGLAVVAGLGLMQIARPYLARVPVLGAVMGSSPAAQPTGLFAGLGA
jgi:hypothetical protein